MNATGDRDRNIAEWSGNGGAAARAALAMASKKLVALLVQDIQRADGDTGPAASEPQVVLSTPAEAFACGPATSDSQCGNVAALLSQDQDGKTFRFKDGSLKYQKLGNF